MSLYNQPNQKDYIFVTILVKFDEKDQKDAFIETLNYLVNQSM